MTLDVRGLERHVDGRTLFEGLSFTVEPGETLVIAGRSGVGKSQLLRLVAWLDVPEAGEILLDGRSPEAMGPPVWRSRVTLVPQRIPSFPDTPRELAHRIARFGTQQGREAGDPVAIAARWNLPEDAWDKAWNKLSGGERQRAGLAIALARRPDVLLLDEPTSALDPEAVEGVETDLVDCTAVWVTHDEDQAERVGTRVMRLGDA